MSQSLMAIGLLTASLVSILGLIVTVYQGFAIHGRTGISQHFLFAMFGTFLVVFAQSMTMFYFIGMGKQVKDLVTNHPMGRDFVVRTRMFKSKVFPPATLAILFTMAAWVIGGGVDTGVLPVFLHTILAVLALVANLQAFVREARFMFAQSQLMDEIDELLHHSPVKSAASAAPK